MKGLHIDNALQRAWVRNDGRRITAEADCRLITNMNVIDWPVHVDTPGDPWDNGPLVLGMAYSIMQLPDPPAQDDMPRLRRLCNEMILDAAFAIMYPRWMYLSERRELREGA